MTKAIISDIDGTLIYRGHSLNKARLPLMLERLRERNIAFCLSTGRTLCDVKSLFGDILQGVYISACDGALSVCDGRLISEYPIKSYYLDYFFGFAMNVTDTRTQSPSYFGIEFHGLQNSYIYTSSPSLFHKENARLGNLVRIYSLSEIKEKIYKISLYGRNIESSPEGTRLCYCKNGIYEYVDSRASKLKAACDIAASLSLALIDFVAFGDSENDAELLSSCGTAYTTYCASRDIFSITEKHTRDVIGTVIRLVDEKRI